MGLNVGNVPVKQVYVGSTSVTAVYVGAEKIWPTSEVYEVSLTDVLGSGTVHPLVSVTVPAGETWNVRIQGTVTKARAARDFPRMRIGPTTSAEYQQGDFVDFSGTITSADSTIAMVTSGATSLANTSFVGTVTIEK